MTSIALCPNCGGQKTVSKPPYIAGDVNSWAAIGTPTYPCPTCEGRGWIRVDSVPQADFDCMKSIVLSSMETAENLMDECLKRADRIKELEAYHNRVRDTHQAREVEFRKTCEKYEIDLELMNEMMKVVNPLIKSGAYAKPSANSRSLAIHMHGLCQTVVQYRHKHGIVG